MRRVARCTLSAMPRAANVRMARSVRLVTDGSMNPRTRSSLRAVRGEASMRRACRRENERRRFTCPAIQENFCILMRIRGPRPETARCAGYPDREGATSGGGAGLARRLVIPRMRIPRTRGPAEQGASLCGQRALLRPTCRHPSSRPLTPVRGDTNGAHRRARGLETNAVGVIPTVKEGTGARVAVLVARPRSEARDSLDARIAQSTARRCALIALLSRPLRRHPSSRPLTPGRGDTNDAHRRARGLEANAVGVIPTVREGTGARVAVRMARPRSEARDSSDADNGQSTARCLARSAFCADHPSSRPLAPVRGDTNGAHRGARGLETNAVGVIPTVREGTGARVAVRTAKPRSEGS
jgi:hypothetical protein